MIHVIATISVRPGQRDAFLSAFRKLVPQVQAEAGCIEYGPAIDLATQFLVQSPVRDDVVTVVEKWESVAALRAHLDATHVIAHREQTKDMVTSLQIQILQPA
jgi:quinol monooxygenase YgiN